MEQAIYGVYKTGGSIGEKTGFVYVGLTKEEAKERAKQMRKHLSPAERKYYKLSYLVKVVKENK